MVTMLPDFLSDSVKSPAEQELFLNFRETETDRDYIVIHSLGLPEHTRNLRGEIDFAVICGRGILVIEVKGGKVYRRDGRWYTENRKGQAEALDKSPFTQARENMYSLLDGVKKKYGNCDPVALCQYAYCVVTPDCVIENRAGIDTEEGCLFDANECLNLEDIVERSFDYAEAVQWERKRYRLYGLDAAGMERARDILLPDLGYMPSMKDVIGGTRKKLNALTEEQQEVFAGLAENDRILVSGGAGTGKTMLAAEQARAMFYVGKSVLFLCYNRGPAAYIREMFAREGIPDIRVSNLHEILTETVPEPSPREDGFYEKTQPAEFVKRYEGPRYDYLVVDEGQDLLTGEYVACMDALLEGGLSGGRWAIFYDGDQSLYIDPSAVSAQLGRLKGMPSTACYRLSRNCRNTKQITEANEKLTRIRNTGTPGADGPDVEYVPYTDSEDACRRTEEILSGLVGGGVSRGDIVILTRHRPDNREENPLFGYVPSKAVGALQTEDVWKRRDAVRFSTVHSFKGLEAEVVVLLAESFSDSGIRTVNYVAITRACSKLYVLYQSGMGQELEGLLAGNGSR